MYYKCRLFYTMSVARRLYIHLDNNELKCFFYFFNFFLLRNRVALVCISRINLLTYTRFVSSEHQRFPSKNETIKNVSPRKSQ